MIKVYARKIWDRYYISYIFTILLCLFTCINFVVTMFVNNLKYNVISNMISFTLLFVHSLNCHTKILKSKDQEGYIFKTFFGVYIIYMMIMSLIPIYGTGSESGLGNTIGTTKWFSILYIIFSLALLNFITYPISSWSCENKLVFFGDGIIKCHYFEYNKPINKDFITFHLKCYKIKNSGLYMLILHNAMSLIILGLSWLFDKYILTYLVVTGLSLLLSMVTVFCKYELSKMYAAINIGNDDNFKCFFEMTNRIKLIFIPYFLFVIVTFFLFIPYGQSAVVKPYNKFFMVQGIIVLIPLVIYIICKIGECVKREINLINDEISDEINTGIGDGQNYGT